MAESSRKRRREEKGDMGRNARGVSAILFLSMLLALLDIYCIQDTNIII